MAFLNGNHKLEQLIACYISVPQESTYAILDGKSVKINDLVEKIKHIIDHLPEIST